MNASNRPRYTRHFYIACLLARSAAFLFLVGYALTAPESFQADLTASPFHLTPLTAVWALLMLSMISRYFPSKVESLGCQKEISGRFRPTGGHIPSRRILHLLREGHPRRPLYGVPRRFLRRLRHHLHPVLLSLPGLDDAQPLLHHLPHLQLGLYHDVYPPDGAEGSLDPLRLRAFCDPAAALGDHPLPHPSALL